MEFYQGELISYAELRERWEMAPAFIRNIIIANKIKAYMIMPYAFQQNRYGYGVYIEKTSGNFENETVFKFDEIREAEKKSPGLSKFIRKKEDKAIINGILTQDDLDFFQSKINKNQSDYDFGNKLFNILYGQASRISEQSNFITSINNFNKSVAEQKTFLSSQTEKIKPLDKRESDSYKLIIAALLNKLGKYPIREAKEGGKSTTRYIKELLEFMGCSLDEKTIRERLADIENAVATNKERQEKKLQN